MPEEEALDEGWPVPEKPEEAGDPKGAGQALPGGGQSESAFLLNLISQQSRMDLFQLSQLEADELLSAFLSGGPAPPRVASMWLSESQANRLSHLIDAVFTENHEEVSFGTLERVRENPPHLLLVHLEKGEGDPEAIIRAACEDLGPQAPDIIALVEKSGSRLLKSPPSWAKAMLSLDMPDSALKLHFERLLELTLVRRDLETIFLAHRVSREQLHRVTFTDPLTGLLNRAGFEDSASRELSRIARTQETLGLIILDIDHFKKVNDTYGHPVGDSVLREIARILRAETRNLDHVIRFGGEEFGVILPHTNKEDIIMVAERIRTQVEAYHFEFMPAQGDITISLGALCIHSKKRPVLGQVYPVCDELLYEAKQSGRNRVISGEYE